MPGELRYWGQGDAAALCLASSSESVTAVFCGLDGVFLGVKTMQIGASGTATPPAVAK